MSLHSFNAKLSRAVEFRAREDDEGHPYLKTAAAVAGAGALGYGAYKAHQWWKGRNAWEPAPRAPGMKNVTPTPAPVLGLPAPAPDIMAPHQASPGPFNPATGYTPTTPHIPKGMSINLNPAPKPGMLARGASALEKGVARLKGRNGLIASVGRTLRGFESPTEARLVMLNARLDRAVEFGRFNTEEQLLRTNTVAHGIEKTRHPMFPFETIVPDPIDGVRVVHGAYPSISQARSGMAKRILRERALAKAAPEVLKPTYMDPVRRRLAMGMWPAPSR